VLPSHDVRSPHSLGSARNAAGSEIDAKHIHAIQPKRKLTPAAVQDIQKQQRAYVSKHLHEVAVGTCRSPRA
jgi:hypothetical protein